MPTAPDEVYDEVEADVSFGGGNPTKASELGECRVCGQMILIRPGSGRLWQHGPNNQYRCRGGSAPPREGTKVPRQDRESRH